MEYLPYLRVSPPKYLLITKRNFTVEKCGQLHLNQMIKDNTINSGATQNDVPPSKMLKKKKEK